MLTANLKMGLAGAAILVAAIVLFADRTIVQGTGLIVATLAAGAGWLVRDANEEARTLKSICQAYAALIETQFEEISDALSDAELERFLELAPRIMDGSEPEAIGKRVPDPYESLPDIRPHMHLLSPETVRFLWKWRVRGMDLFFIYDELGTRALSQSGTERLTRHFDWVKRYRDEYRDIGFTALLCLARESPGLAISLDQHRGAQARSLLP